MLTFVQTWFTPGAQPVGVDFGTSRLRMAQVERDGVEFRLIAAATAEVPPSIRENPADRASFLATTLRALWSKGNFRGRRVMLSVPAASTFIGHLRLPKVPGADLHKAIERESHGKLPIDPSQSLVRHLVAGDVYHENEPHTEVILLGAQRQIVDQILSAAARARLDVVGMNVEPRAILDCFLNIYRRKSDTNITNCFIDIGSTASRAVVSNGDRILFARVVPVGGEHFSRAVASRLKITLEDASLMRTRSTMPLGQPEHERSALPGLADPTDTDGILQEAMKAPLGRMIEELLLCRRYHDATFPDRRIERVIFVGGEAHDRRLCVNIARELGIAAQIGDPLVRMGRTTDVGIESGIDRRLPQPGWAVAIGLSMGAAVSSPQVQPALNA